MFSLLILYLFLFLPIMSILFTMPLFLCFTMGFTSGCVLNLWLTILRFTCSLFNKWLCLILASLFLEHMLYYPSSHWWSICLVNVLDGINRTKEVMMILSKKTKENKKIGNSLLLPSIEVAYIFFYARLCFCCMPLLRCVFSFCFSLFLIYFPPPVCSHFYMITAWDSFSMLYCCRRLM